MPQVKKVAVAVLISMSFFFSDVVFAEQSEVVKENKASTSSSSKVLRVVAEKYSKVVQIYEAMPGFVRQTGFAVKNEAKDLDTSGIVIVEVEQRTIVYAGNRNAKSMTAEKPTRKPGHTHEETRHEVEKIGPEEEES